jgi:hypothetical protein
LTGRTLRSPTDSTLSTLRLPSEIIVPLLAFLFILGGLLELAGFGLVTWDLVDDWLKRNALPSELPTRRSGLMWNRYTSAEEIDARAGGNLGHRALGVVLFVAGLVVQTIANVAALYSGS